MAFAARSRLAADAAHLHRRIAELADARLRAGDASALEISAARIEAQRAREVSARQTQELVLARERLRALLGHVFSEADFQFEGSPEVPRADFNVRVLVSDALADRRDVRAAEISVDAACGRAGLAQLEYLSVVGLIDANGDGEKGFEAGPGLQLTLPIFHCNDDGIAWAELERSVGRRLSGERRGGDGGPVLRIAKLGGLASPGPKPGAIVVTDGAAELFATEFGFGK